MRPIQYGYLPMAFIVRNQTIRQRYQASRPFRRAKVNDVPCTQRSARMTTKAAQHKCATTAKKRGGVKRPSDCEISFCNRLRLSAENCSTCPALTPIDCHRETWILPPRVASMLAPANRNQSVRIKTKLRANANHLQSLKPRLNFLQVDSRVLGYK